MTKIKAHDKIQLNCSVDEVWNILTNIPQYHEWWPKSVNLEVSNFSNEIVGTQFEARPLGGKAFSCKVVNVISKSEINLNYFEGIYRGEGTWNVESKNDLVNVSYKVDLEIVDKSVAFLSMVVSIPKLHSMIFKKILSGLERQVKAKFKQTSNQ